MQMATSPWRPTTWHLSKFYLLNQFWAALPVDLRRVINLQPMHTLDLDTAVHLATVELCSKDEARGTTHIQAVQPDEEEDGVDAVAQNRQKKFFPQNQQNRGQQNRHNFRPQTNYRNIQSSAMEKQQSRQQLLQKQDDMHFLPEARPPTRGMQEEDQFQPALFGPQRQTFLA
jgi:hypothetical protein